MYFYIRRFIRDYYLSFMGSFAKPAKGIHILNGHMVHRSNPNQTIFSEQLEMLDGYATFIRIEEAVRLIEEHRKVNDVLLAFTFDDGFQECLDWIAPTLEAFGVNGLFFINPNFVESDENYIRNFTENIVSTPDKYPMRWESIQTLQDNGHIIGAHTMDHYMINNEDTDVLEYQIGYCKTIIESKLNTSCDYFAFPYGRLDDVSYKAIEIASKYYKHIFSQTNYKNYFSFEGKVINRRHFEPFWPVSHVKYFISHHKRY